MKACSTAESVIANNLNAFSVPPFAGLSLDLFLSGLCGLFGWTAVNVARAVMFFDVAKSMPTGTRYFGDHSLQQLALLCSAGRRYLPSSVAEHLVLASVPPSATFARCWHPRCPPWYGKDYPMLIRLVTKQDTNNCLPDQQEEIVKLNCRFDPCCSSVLTMFP